MVKKWLVMILVAYFFIIQAFIAWAIWQDSHFYTLWCINLLFFILFFFGVNAFKWDKWENKQEKWSSYPIVKERIAEEKVSETVEEKPVAETIVEEKESEVFRRVRNDRPISESNIEYIKTKINRTKRKPLREWSAIYRFLVFLIALLLLWGILNIFWDSLDFIALIIWSIAMLIFIWVCFRSANLWRKSLFSSIYFLLFFLAMLLWIIGMVFAGNSKIDALKDDISTFFNGVKWEETVVVNEIKEENDNSGFVLESTGSVISFSLTWWDSVFASWDALTWEQSNASDSAVTTEESTVKEVNESAKEQTTQPVVEQKTETTTAKVNTPTSQVTMIEAIKHLIKTYNIPLSKSTSTKFTHVSKSNGMYPYMKTALDKRMIWTTTDPQMIVSCDVYMVMKWIAEWWNITKSPEIKENYWNVAESKGMLNWCTKWAKLTYANL